MPSRFFYVSHANMSTQSTMKTADRSPNIPYTKNENAAEMNNEYPSFELRKSFDEADILLNGSPQSCTKASPAKRQNRRRVRHRPRRARTSCCSSNSTSMLCNLGSLQHSLFIRPSGWHNTSNALSQSHARSKEQQWYFPSARIREDNESRDRRFFGGTTDDDEDDDAPDLRGAMLDVVLGLFDGIDYED